MLCTDICSSAAKPSTTCNCQFPAARSRAGCAIIRAKRPRSRSTMVEAGSRLSDTDKVLLLGVTGVTGRCALSGLLAGGLKPSQLLAVSRNPNGAAATSLQQQGVEVVGGDLDSPSSLLPHLARSSALYCHALSGDSASADPAELARATALAQLLSSSSESRGLQLVVYNGSAGRGSKAGITQMDQKHAVEDVLLGAGLPGLMLESTMFMEEFWKKYTRPGLINGTFTFSLPGDQPLQLVAARDLGLAAATAFTSSSMSEWAGQRIPLAGDELTPLQMCDAFSAAQGGMPVKHSSPPAWIFWFLSRDLWRITRFLRETGYKADVASCRAMFPGMFTFADFLAASCWGDTSRTYEQGIRFDGPTPTRQKQTATSKR
eukprot:GHUV01000969.1.p1 GENE.GHUV01000969.1~~GHUV01000969.1.p1  ORF type:complete len:375 (+),score=124.40 GHUV01000969.1:138-1262(+)